MAVDEMSFVVTTLERINAKLDKHDDKIDMIVTALQQLVKVDTENKEIKEALGRVFKRVEALEHNQNTDGCAAHKAFVRLRDEQLKKYDAIIVECKEDREEIKKRVEILEQKPMKAMDKLWMALLGALGTGVGGYILLKIGVTK